MTTPSLDLEITAAGDGFAVALRTNDGAGVAARPLRLPLDFVLHPPSPPTPLPQAGEGSRLR